MANELILSCFVFIIFISAVRSAVIRDGLDDNEIKDSMGSNVDIFECFRDKEVLNCVWQRAGKYLESLEHEADKQMKELQKADEKTPASSGRTLELLSPFGGDVDGTLQSIAKTMVTITRTLRGKDDDNTTSADEEPLTEYGLVKGLRQLNKKGNGYMLLIGLGSLFISKMMFYLNLIRLKLQFKFFLIALIALALNIARFLMEWQQKHAHHAHLAPKIVYRDDEAIAGGYAGEEWKRTKEQEAWDDEDERYPYRGHEKFQPYNRIRSP